MKSSSRRILAYGRYWLQRIEQVPDNEPLPDTDIRSVARALEMLISLDGHKEAWDITKRLGKKIHLFLERQGYWEEWTLFLGKLQETAHRYEDKESEAEWLFQLGSLFNQRRLQSDALSALRQSFFLFSQGKNKSGRAKTYSDLANLYRQKGYFQRAEILCQEAIRLSETLEDSIRLAIAHNHMGYILLDQAKWEAAEYHLATSVSGLEKAEQYSYFLAKTLQNSGTLYLQMGHLDRAQAALNKAITLYQQSGDQVYVARSLLCIGAVQAQSNNILQAYEVVKQAEHLLNMYGGEAVDFGETYHNLGLIETELKNWQSSEAYFKRALQIWTTLPDDWNKANTILDLTALYIAKQDKPLAKHYALEAELLLNQHLESHFHTLREALAQHKTDIFMLKESNRMSMVREG
ncbi:MAG: tetratricopeptide repeat protein [Chloroflexota bacterium]